MRSIIFKQLDEDFDAEELNPVWKDGNEKDGGSADAIEDLVDKLPEQMSIKFRQAAMEAVVEAIVEDAEEESPEAVTEEEIRETVDPIVDKAVALCLVPSTIKERITRMLAARYRKADPRVELLERAARYMTDAAIEVVEENGLKEDDPVIEKELDYSPADEGTDVSEETIEPKIEELPQDGTVPTQLYRPMRNLAKHSIAQRRAMAQVIHRGAGVQLAKMLDDLKFHLPESFKKKYRIA